jgi:D-tagatose-1,6-bisphosphate aldolase subunit GatZ/KbaZ
MRALLNIVARHKAGESVGIYSICCAHPLALKAACLYAAQAPGAPIALIEATSNQVNQYGGYTGMRPADFVAFVHAIAHDAGLPLERLALGGDHLGPNAWRDQPAEAAMREAETMVALYVEAGFRKIHLDCSMSCADDPPALTDAIVAARAARLCAAAETAWGRAGGEPPVYIIGTEVPAPGGAQEDLGELAVTTPGAAAATLDTHAKIFAAHGLSDAWKRVIAAVVQPGVEFDHDMVVDYRDTKARALSQYIESRDGIVFEAHSTDYQTPKALAQLVRDHYAILKVGPGLTFALREALFALDAIERDWLGAKASGFRETCLRVMRREPKHWKSYYHSEGQRLDFDLQYSLSDRIRYYWPHPEIEVARAKMFANLASAPPALALVSQYMPSAYTALREGRIRFTPEAITIHHLFQVIDTYARACTP